MSEESTKAAIEARAAEIAASLGPTIPIGLTAAEATLIAEIHVALPNLEAAIDERIRQLTPSGAIVVIDKVRDLLPLVGPILTMLGLGQHAGKAGDAAKILREILDLTDGR